MRDEQHRDVELGRKRFQKLQDLELRRDVERRRRLVGDDQAGRAGKRAGDHQPLPLTAGELVRIALEHRLGLGDLHPPQDVDEAVAMVPHQAAPERVLGGYGACQRITASS